MEQKEFLVLEEAKTKELLVWETSEYESLVRMCNQTDADTGFRVVLSFDRNDSQDSFKESISEGFLQEAVRHADKMPISSPSYKLFWLLIQTLHMQEKRINELNNQLNKNT